MKNFYIYKSIEPQGKQNIGIFFFNTAPPPKKKQKKYSYLWRYRNSCYFSLTFLLFLLWLTALPGGHAYALSRKGRRLLLDLLDNKRPDVYETDEGQPIDEIFMYLARLSRANLYSIIPDLVVQRPLFKSDIFGTPAGFEDGMHGKPLLDSALARLPPPSPSHQHLPRHRPT